MRVKFLISGLALVISIVAASWWLTRPSPLPTLTVAADKEFYIQGENIEITVRNVSDRTISLTDVRNCIEKYDGANWQFYAGKWVEATLEPNEEVHVICPLTDWGRYRAVVGDPPAWAEFLVDPENFIVITTDKKIYYSGENMWITFKNNSYKRTAEFYDYGYVIEVWNGATWRLCWPPDYSIEVMWELGPGGEVTKRFAWGYFSYPGGGKFRLCASGENLPPAYAEFELAERSEVTGEPIAIWIVLAVVVIAVVGIAIAYLVRKRMRG